MGLKLSKGFLSKGFISKGFISGLNGCIKISRYSSGTKAMTLFLSSSTKIVKITNS